MRLAFLLLILVLVVSCRPPRPAWVRLDRTVPERILLVTIDTLRADHTSAFGYELRTTPHLKALAARGVRFENCLAQHVETGPSLASIMTSRYPREIGVRANGDVLPREFATLAERMAAGGYRTAAFVSTYLLKPHVAGLHRGFDHYDAAMTRANLGHEKFERRADETVDRAIRFLEETHGRRVFLWVHLYDPHGKYDPGPELTRRFYRSTGRPKLDATKIVGYQRFHDSLDPNDYVARYDGEIFVADRALGRLLDAAGGNALVAVAADHGEGLGEDDYWFRHGSLLNRAALHVPLVFAGPGIGAVHTERAVTRNLDIAPTLLDLAGLDPLPDARGRSLSGRDRSPVASFAEARRRGGVGDRTGVDTRYKVSITTETGHTVHRPGAEDCPSEALRDWLLETGDRTADGSVDPDVEDALRGLGYSR